MDNAGVVLTGRIALAEEHNAWDHFCAKIDHPGHSGWPKRKLEGGAEGGAKKAPPPGKRYFLATMDVDLSKDMKQAGIAMDKSASEFGNCR